MKYCARPFEEFEIDVDGKCYCCCRWWNKSYCLGNIFEQSPEEIWNGQEAQELRRSILEGDYKYCNIKECLPNHTNNDVYRLNTDYPREVVLCYDYTCSAKCVFCNDEIKKMSNDECFKWDSLIDSKIIPLLQNAKLVRLSMVGEVFMSEHSKNLIKQIVGKYPNINFEIVSNGILCNEKIISELGLTDRIESIKFSIPSIRKKTYKRLVKNGNLQSVKKNLLYVSNLAKENKINDFRLNFIISSVNYKELPNYIEYADKLGATVDCLLLDKKDESTEFLKNFDFYNVASPNHPKYNDFINVINSSKFKKYKNVCINKNIQALKKNSILKQIKNIIVFYKKYSFKH